LDPTHLLGLSALCLFSCDLFFPSNTRSRPIQKPFHLFLNPRVPTSFPASPFRFQKIRVLLKTLRIETRVNTLPITRFDRPFRCLDLIASPPQIDHPYPFFFPWPSPPPLIVPFRCSFPPCCVISRHCVSFRDVLPPSTSILKLLFLSNRSSPLCSCLKLVRGFPIPLSAPSPK